MTVPADGRTVAAPASTRRTVSALFRSANLTGRLVAAVLVLACEKAVLNLFVDFSRVQQAQGLGAALRTAQHWGFRFLVSLVVAILLFGWLSERRELADADAAARGARVRTRWLALHALLAVPLAPLSMALYSQATPLALPAVVASWVVLAGFGVVALFLALAPWSLWRRAVQALGVLWAYSAAAAGGSVAVMGASQQLWSAMSKVTFEAVYRLLESFIPSLRIDPSALIIDTGRFAVAIDPVCSGLEGMGLMLAFCGVLLLLFRKEFIFPRALILLPAGLLLSFALNVLRIALLVLIGSAGYSAVAVYGFHSQAGWIAFNFAAAALALVSLRSGWLTRGDWAWAAGENPTAVYLLPFLALLAAGMVSRAVSGGVELLYGLRLLGVGLAMIYSWPRLRGVVWRCSWRGPAAGVIAFALWSIAARLLGHPAAAPVALPDISPPARALWLAVHLAVSVAAVPIAEELAFRGYLLRRLTAADFEAVPPGSVRLWALLLSSLVFGFGHGTLWVPGTISGLVFGWLYMRTQHLGEAVAAHAIANALIALTVLGDVPWQSG